MDKKNIECIIEATLFASGEPVSSERIAEVLNVTQDEVLNAAQSLSERLINDSRGIRLIKLDNLLQLCSAPEYSDYIRTALETRKQPRLSQNALEVLSVVAYFQPVTRAFIENIRGVDSSYTVSVLQNRGLIEQCGNLDAPGRPALFKTTNNFLRCFGLSSLSELPPLPDVNNDNSRTNAQKYNDKLSSEITSGNNEGLGIKKG